MLADNYTWIVAGTDGGALVVDPGEAAPVRRALMERGLRLDAVLATHHHGDHVGGIAELVAETPEVTVLASAYDVGRCRVPAANRAVDDGESLTLAGTEVRVLAVPGHTLGAVAFHLPQLGAVFTGDTLFLAGCGRLFEGDAASMWRSLRRLRALPASTQVCCGHDYLEKNLRFAATVLPASELRPFARADVTAHAAGHLDGTGPQDAAGAHPPGPARAWASLGLERRRNPFLRADDPALQRTLGTGDDVATFAELRRRRDVFR